MIILKSDPKPGNDSSADDYIETIDDYRDHPVVDQFNPSLEDFLIEDSPNSPRERKELECRRLALKSETLILRLGDATRWEMRKDTPNFELLDEITVEAGGVESFLDHLPKIASRTNSSELEDYRDVEDARSQLEMFERRVELYEQEAGIVVKNDEGGLERLYLSEDTVEETEAGFEPNIRVTQPESASEIEWEALLRKGPQKS